MILLAIDCSHPEGSLCIQRDFEVLFSDSWKQEKSHAELLPVFIEKGLTKSQISLEKIDAFAVTTGPGSFTGIRIAINTIKTLSYTLNKKIFTATSLQVIAHANKAEIKNLVVAIDAHSNLYYTQKFSKQNSNGSGNWLPGADIEVVKHSDLEQILKTPNCTFAVNAIPSATALGDYILKKINDLSPLSWSELEPLYIRLSAPEEKTGKS